MTPQLRALLQAQHQQLLPAQALLWGTASTPAGLSTCVAVLAAVAGGRLTKRSQPLSVLVRAQASQACSSSWHTAC